MKRIYIPLPDIAGRKQLLMTLMKSSLHSLKRDDLGNIPSYPTLPYPALSFLPCPSYHVLFCPVLTNFISVLTA